MKADEFVDLVRAKIMEDESGEEEALLAQEVFRKAAAERDVGLLLRDLAKRALPQKNYKGLRKMTAERTEESARRAADRILAEGAKLAAQRGVFAEDVLEQMHFSGSRRRK